MALGDKKNREAIRALRQEAGQAVASRVVVDQRQRKKARQKKIRADFSLRVKERSALTELTDLLEEKSDSELLGKLIMRAYKAATDPTFNRDQTDIFDFL